jgi:hypothetical protein
MRWWKNREYKPGEMRYKTVFLWFPKCLPVGALPLGDENKQWRWLEKARIFQRYDVNGCMGEFVVVETYGWVDKCWSDD